MHTHTRSHAHGHAPTHTHTHGPFLESRCLHRMQLHPQCFRLKYFPATNTGPCHPVFSAMASQGHISEEDAHIGHRKRAPHTGGRVSHDVLLQRDGPLSVMFVIGQPAGRWFPVTTHRDPECQGVCALLRAAGTGDGAPEAPGVDYLAGIVVMRGWHFVTGHASHEHSYALMKAEMACVHRRAGQRFMEHKVLASATAIGHQLRPCVGWDCKVPGRVVSDFVAQCDARELRFRVRSGIGVGTDLPVQLLLQQWS